MKKIRTIYLIITILLLFIEILIALFAHNEFVRGYIGDILVVILLYTFVRIFIPKGCKRLPLFIFVFAAGVEVLQYFNLVELLGVADNRFLSVLLGTVFDIKDVFCYAAGCLLLGVYECLFQKSSKHSF